MARIVITVDTTPEQSDWMKTFDEPRLFPDGFPEDNDPRLLVMLAQMGKTLDWWDSLPMVKYEKRKRAENA